MRNLIKALFFPLFGRIHTKRAPQPPRASGPSSDCVHLFHGMFASELEATDYCLSGTGQKDSQALARDLPDAVIDLDEVEIIFGAARIAAAAPMFAPNPLGLLDKMGTDNTIIMISEVGFCGLPFELNDTPKLRYAGPYTVT